MVSTIHLITLTNFDATAGEYKIKIASKTLYDESGNTNKDTEIGLNAKLRVAGTWDEYNGWYNYEGAGSGFLGNTNIQRQKNAHNVGAWFFKRFPLSFGIKHSIFVVNG